MSAAHEPTMSAAHEPTMRSYEFVDPMHLRPGDTFQRPGLEHVYTVLGRNESLSVPGLLYLRLLIVDPTGRVSKNDSVGLEVPGDLELSFLGRAAPTDRATVGRGV